MMADFNKAQQLAVSTYGGGDFAWVTTMGAAEEAGDTLLLFILRELADSECEDLHEAARRIVHAMRQLAEVRDALRNALPQET